MGPEDSQPNVLSHLGLKLQKVYILQCVTSFILTLVLDFIFGPQQHHSAGSEINISCILQNNILIHNKNKLSEKKTVYIVQVGSSDRKDQSSLRMNNTYFRFY